MNRSTRIARGAPTRKLLLELADMAEEMAAAARAAAEDYPWATNTSKDLRVVGDAAKVRTHAADPTGAQALSGRPEEGEDRKSRQDVMTILIRKALRKITAGTSRFKEASDFLNDALDLADPHRRQKDEGTRTTPFPKLVKDEELADYAGARDRRTARGEGWGEG